MKINLLKLFCTVLIITSSLETLDAQWVQVASPPSNFITDHSYGFALDGKGYLVTGTTQNGQPSNNFYQYDPELDSFTQLDDFPGSPRGFAIGDTWDGKAYFGFGGGINRFDDLWVFDPAAGTWEELASCPCSERTHPALVANNGKVYVGLGGSAFGDLDDWWIYDIATDSWEIGARFPGLARHHPYQFGIGEFVYVGFGHGGPNIFNEWYRYDPATNMWDEVATLPAEGRVAGQQFSWNGKGYVLSGEGDDHSAMEEGEFWEYDPELDVWTELPPHPGTSRWAPASFVLNDEVYLFNGIVYGFGPPTSMSEAYKYNLNQGLSSTSNVEETLNITIQPNPANDYISILTDEIDVQEGKYTIYNISGKEVLHINQIDKTRIDITSLESGLYILSSQDKKITRQFVINR